MLCSIPRPDIIHVKLRYLIHCCIASTSTSILNNASEHSDNTSKLNRNDKTSPTNNTSSSLSHIISIDDMDVAMSKHADAPFFLTTLLYPYIDRTKH